MNDFASMDVSETLLAGPRLHPIRTRPAAGFTDYLEDKAEPVTPAGRAFCHPLFNVHILVIVGLRSPIPLDVLKDGISNTLLKHKRFCSVVRKDAKKELYWVKKEVNLDDHILIPELKDEERDSANFVEDYVAQLAQAPPLDMSRPLFEFHILKAKLGDAVENVIFRVHHALGDGTSLMSLLLACTRRTDVPEALPTMQTHSTMIKHRKVSFWRKGFLVLWSFFLILWNSLCEIFKFLATICWMDDSETPIKGFPGVEHSAKKLAHKTISLKDIRVVKQAIKGTVNDVVLGMLSAGLSSYLLDHYGTVDGGKMPPWALNQNYDVKEHVPKNQKSTLRQSPPLLDHLRVRASILVNTRPSPGLHELKDMMTRGSKVRWGNHMGYIILPVPLSSCMDPLESLYKAKKIIDRKKLSLEAIFSYKCGALLMKLFGSEVPVKLTYRCTSHATLSFSNVMGPAEEVQIFGNRIAHIIPTVSGQPQSLCVHVQSYMGKVTIVVLAAKDVIPDPENLCRHMARALDRMKQKIITGL